MNIFKRKKASVDDKVITAARRLIKESRNEWLYQTGQLSRRANPPSQYPPQGSVWGAMADAANDLEALLEVRDDNAGQHPRESAGVAR